MSASSSRARASRCVTSKVAPEMVQDAAALLEALFRRGPIHPLSSLASRIRCDLFPDPVGGGLESRHVAIVGDPPEALHARERCEGLSVHAGPRLVVVESPRRGEPPHAEG